MAGKAPTNIRKYFDGFHLNKPILSIEKLGIPLSLQNPKILVRDDAKVI
jgi:hypothetical protein